MRRSKGGETCEASKRIELSWLLKNGFLKKGKGKQGTLSWTYRGESSGSISIMSIWVGPEIFIEVSYTSTDNQTGEKKEHRHRIDLVTVPSNLGKGEVLYFVCPVRGRRCRILYMAYGYDKFVGRSAYRKTLFYESQTSSKFLYSSQRYHTIVSQLDEIYAQQKLTLKYKGKPTRIALRIQDLENQLEYWSIERMNPKNFPKSMRHLTDDIYYDEI